MSSCLVCKKYEFLMFKLKLPSGAKEMEKYETKLNK